MIPMVKFSSLDIGNRTLTEMKEFLRRYRIGIALLLFCLPVIFYVAHEKKERYRTQLVAAERDSGQIREVLLGTEFQRLTVSPYSANGGCIRIVGAVANNRVLDKARNTVSRIRTDFEVVWDVSVDNKD